MLTDHVLYILKVDLVLYPFFKLIALGIFFWKSKKSNSFKKI